MKYLIILIAGLLLTGCGEPDFIYREVQLETCTVSSMDNVVIISCPDGTSETIAVPSNGIDGVDGESFIGEVIDPCGDDPNKPDEVLIKLADGQFVAWYVDLGLSVLEPGRSYQTTDSQRCSFNISLEGVYSE